MADMGLRHVEGMVAPPCVEANRAECPAAWPNLSGAWDGTSGGQGRGRRVGAGVKDRGGEAFRGKCGGERPVCRSGKLSSPAFRKGELFRLREFLPYFCKNG